LSRRLVFLADAHLFPAPVPHPGRERLLGLLESLRSSETGDLWIAGDLFDYWFEHGGRAPRGHEEVLSAIRALGTAGWRVYFLPGNHDWWVGSSFTDASGASVVRSRIVHLESDGLKIELAHGDGLGGGDFGYRFLLRPLLRNPVSIALFSLLPAAVGCLLGRAASGTSRRILRKQKETMPEGLRRWAEERLAGEADVVITAHTHLAAEMPAGRGLHISLGDWISSFTWAEVREGRARLLASPEESPAASDSGGIR
jgi:UDP-2,3-diacylglucosamine hydrolase